MSLEEEGAAPAPASVDELAALLAAQDYLCDRGLATALFLSLRLARPLFLEGEPGVGKTELAKTLARALGATLLRVQCYEGLDVAQTAYEWNVARQMLEIRLAEAAHDVDRERLARSLYAREMLVTLDHPTRGEYVQVGMPINLSDSPVEHKRSPLLGEHTDEILKWLGHNDADIAAMKQEGAV